MDRRQFNSVVLVGGAILLHTAPVEQGRLLKHHAHAARTAAANVPFVILIEPGDHAQQRGFFAA